MLRFGVELFGFGYQYLGVYPFHGVAQTPVQYPSAIPVEDAQEVIKRALNLDVRKVGMPLLVDGLRLDELPFRRLDYLVPLAEASGIPSPDGRRTAPGNRLFPNSARVRLSIFSNCLCYKEL
jgi:hypothetical protein